MSVRPPAGGARAKALVLLCALLAGTAFLISAAQADNGVTSTPLAGFPTVNGDVEAEAVSGSTLYVGGDFSSVGPDTGSFASFATSSGTAATLPATDGSVYVVVSDGSGGWYIGGNFTTVGGVAVTNLAHITSAGRLDTSFEPDPSQPVHALALSPDGNTLYVGANSLLGYSTSNGAPTGFDGAVQNSGSVDALAVSSDGNTLYVGGTFNTGRHGNSVSIGGAVRDHLAALSTSTGLATSFNPSPDQSVTSLALSSDGSDLYVGGQFSTIGGAGRQNLAEVSTAGTGPAVAGFDPAPDQPVNAIALSPDNATLYAGGNFSFIGGQNRTSVAAVSTASGDATSFDAGSVAGTVFSLAVSADGNTLYAGGSFAGADSVGGADRDYFAAFNTADGTVTSFNPGPNSFVLALALSSDGSALAVGGDFDSSQAQGSVDRTNLAAIDLATGAVKSFAPNPDRDVDALAVSPDGSTLYAGGRFETIGGQTRNYLAAVSTSTGLATSFDPEPDSSVFALALSPDGSTLYTGGAFSQIGGQDLTSLAAVSTSTGLANPSFAPQPSGSDSDVEALQLSPDGQTLYAGGDFEQIGGQVRSDLAAVSTANGVANSFDPEADSSVDALALSPSGGIIYAGGYFHQIGGQNRSELAALRTSTGSATSFDPEPNNNVNALVLSPDGGTLYVGGDFSGGDSIAGTDNLNYLAGVSTSSGAATAFDPGLDGDAYALALGGTSLYVVGSFQTVGSELHAGLARFPGTPVASFPAHPGAATYSSSADFSFGSSEPGSIFQCSVDGGPYSDCSSPDDLSGLAVGPHTLSVKALFDAMTSAPSTYSWDVVSPDGSGTLTTRSTAVSPTTHHTVTFSYRAAMGGLVGGTVQFVVPSGWSAPSTSGTDPGYTTASTGSVSVSGQTVTVSGLTLAGGQAVAIHYGSTERGGPGASAQEGGDGGWQASEQSADGGTLTALAGEPPRVHVVAADGSGTLQTPTSGVPHGSTGNTIVFTYTAAEGGMVDGSVQLVVPNGWSAPSAILGAHGYTFLSSGSLSITGRTITVSGLTLSGGQTLTITYGSRLDDGPGATAPRKFGPQTWQARQRGLASRRPAKLGASPQIIVTGGV